MSTRREKRARRGLPGRVKVPLRERKRAEREAFIEAIPDDITAGEVLLASLTPLEAKIIPGLLDPDILDAPVKALMKGTLGGEGE